MKLRGTLTLSSEFKYFGPKLDHKEQTFCHILMKHHKYIVPVILNMNTVTQVGVIIAVLYRTWSHSLHEEHLR